MERVFLLGGHDLEMLEIKRLLMSHGERFVDAGLDWDCAFLSAYLPFILKQPDSDYYGVELQEDCTLPRHYTRIDHHNDYNNRPASILQVAEILGVTPDKHMQLIAANDAGYIPAMQVLNASEEEIADIRKRDRAAQGVSEEDEKMAELSVSEYLTAYEGLFVVYAQTHRFSAICDRLYPYQRLLIYTDNEWTYYGEGKSELVGILADDIYNNKVYHGGGNNGYIGTIKGAFSTTQIHDFVTTLKQRYERN